jgi:hypothetical protein
MTSRRRGRPPGRVSEERRKRRMVAKLRGGSIYADEVLTLREFCLRFGVRKRAIEEMIATGMKFRVQGRYTRVWGQDFLDYISKLPVRGPNKTVIPAGN